jgi:hypothetical protein
MQPVLPRGGLGQFDDVSIRRARSDMAVSHPKPVMIEARWRRPPHFRNVGAWLNAALKSTKVVAVSTAEHREYRAHAIC